MTRKTVIIAMVLILLFSGFAYAEEDEVATENLNSLKTAIKNSEGIPLSTSGGRILVGMSRDLFNVARYVVITALLIRLLMMFVDFSNAGDNPQLKATIKSKSVWLSLGVIFALNFWSIYTFTANVMSNLSL